MCVWGGGERHHQQHNIVPVSYFGVELLQNLLGRVPKRQYFLVQADRQAAFDWLTSVMRDRVKAKTRAGQARVRDQDQTSLRVKCGTSSGLKQAQQAAAAGATRTVHLVTKRHIEGIKSKTE